MKLNSKALNALITKYSVKYIVLSEEGYKTLKEEYPRTSDVPKEMGYSVYQLGAARIINERELRVKKQ
jgi:Fe-S oxidoreductase